MIMRREIALDEPLTAQQQKMLEELQNRPVQPDQDCPELTPAQIAKLAAAAREYRQQRQNKQTITLRLSPQALAKAKSLGKGYTSVLSRILEAALADNAVLRHYL